MSGQLLRRCANGRKSAAIIAMVTSTALGFGTLTRATISVPARYPGRTIASFGALFALAYALSVVMLPKPGGRVVVGDATHYFVYVRSAVFDRDLQFRNEYVRLYGLKGGEPGTGWVFEPTPTGHTRNLMPVGSAIMWLPLYGALSALLALGHAAGLGSGPPDGYERLLQASTGLTGIAAATVGAWLTFRLCDRVVGRSAAIWATLGMWLGSSALYYSLISPAYSHAVSMLTASAFLYAWGISIDRQEVPRYASLGALGGICALVRWQDAVFLVVPAIDAAYHVWAARTLRFPRAVILLVACGAAAGAAFLPQIAVWMTLYGRALAIPQGPDFMRWGSPHIVELLFADKHGLLSWTPIVVLAFAGLVPLVTRHRLVGLAVIATVLVSVYVNSVVADWWGGEAYGARRLVSCFPAFTLAAAALFARIDRTGSRMAAISIVFIGLNLLLMVQYQAFMHGLRHIAPYPEGWYGLYVARFVTPFKLLFPTP